MNAILLSWLVEVGLISLNSITKGPPAGAVASAANKANFEGKRMPLPADLVASAIVWGALGILAEWHQATKVATLIGIGLNVATFLVPYTPVKGQTKVSGATQQFAQLFPGSVWSPASKPIAVQPAAA